MKNNNNYGLIAGLWTAIIIAFAMIVITLVFANGYGKALEDLKRLQADYDVLQTANKEYLHEWGNCKRSLDFYTGEWDAIPVCQNDAARIEYLEGQLESCNRAYSEEKHDRRFYQKALEDVPAYCSLGLNQFVIDGLRAELDACNHQKGLLQHGLADALNDRRICKEELLGAPCHSHYEGDFVGVHCGWGPPIMLYECGFGELGWVGPDREICASFGNTLYREASAVCSSDRNCSSCLVMTGGNLEHCWAFAYYP